MLARGVQCVHTAGPCDCVARHVGVPGAAPAASVSAAAASATALALATTASPGSAALAAADAARAGTTAATGSSTRAGAPAAWSQGRSRRTPGPPPFPPPDAGRACAARRRPSRRCPRRLRRGPCHRRRCPRCRPTRWSRASPSACRRSTTAPRCPCLTPPHSRRARRSTRPCCSS